MGVEEGAFSGHSKLMPKPSQILQIISKLGRVDGICMAVLKFFKGGSRLNSAADWQKMCSVDGFDRLVRPLYAA